jgi:hypothetical protein
VNGTSSPKDFAIPEASTCFSYGKYPLQWLFSLFQVDRRLRRLVRRFYPL